MGDHEDTVRILEVELGQVEQAFRGLSEEDWRAPTKLRPLDEAKPPWTLFELAGDDLAWVRAASGRGPAHPDPRLPLIG
jgi:hypothetical protein